MHEKFDVAILSNGFEHNVSNKCLYVKNCDDCVFYCVCMLMILYTNFMSKIGLKIFESNCIYQLM